MPDASPVRDLDATDEPDLLAATIRARILGIDPTGMTTAEIKAAIDQVVADRRANPTWLIGRPGEPGGTVEETATALVATADRFSTHGPLGDVLYDLLVNAAGHRPAFAERADGTKNDEPWGCEACGCADGVGPCDTWESAIALAKALTDQTGVTVERRVHEGRMQVRLATAWTDDADGEEQTR